MPTGLFGVFDYLSKAAQDLSKELSPQPATGSAPGEEKPVPVEIRRNPFSPLQIVQTILGSLFSLLLTAVLVVVFVIFMLIQREDLRDRVICMVGLGQLNLTTQALDEAGRRVSSYLLAQLAVNAVYGTLAGIGLYFLGVPNPVLWGVFAALLRYLPYLGIWIAAMMPAAVAVAVSPGWMKPAGPGSAFPEPETLVQTAVVSMPARDEADEIGAFMLAMLLNRRGVPTKSIPAAALASERLNDVAPASVKIACVSAVPPSGYKHVTGA